MTPARIRPATAADRPALDRFMAVLQDHERSMDAALLRPGPEMAAGHMACLLAEVAAREGVVLIAEDPETGAPLGFAIAHVEEEPGPMFEDDARRRGRLTDLFVIDQARHQGIGRALIAACEAHFRDLGLHHMQIGVLAGNRPAQRVYEAAGYRDWLHIMTRRIA